MRVVRRQHVEQAPQDRLGVADQRDRRLVQAAGLLRIGVDADDLEVLVDAPLPELDQHAGADAEHHVGLAPQLVAERQRHAQRIAAVEHAAAAAIAEHRRLQHGGQRGHLAGGILRAAAADDHRIFRSAEALRGLAQRGLVELGRGAPAAAAAPRPGPLLPQTSMAHSSAAGPGRPVAIERIASATRRGASLGLADARRIIDQPRDDAGLVADLVQMAEMAADVGVGDLPDQRQHRRVHANRR